MTGLPDKTIVAVMRSCPCRKPLKLELHEVRSGVMERGHAPTVLRSYMAAEYHDAWHGRGFCSARCALLWNDLFARAFAAHTGADPVPVVSDWWFRSTPA